LFLLLLLLMLLLPPGCQTFNACFAAWQVFYLGYAGLKQVDLSDDLVVAAGAVL
jgi:hypothetical protein